MTLSKFEDYLRVYVEDFGSLSDKEKAVWQEIFKIKSHFDSKDIQDETEGIYGKYESKDEFIHILRWALPIFSVVVYFIDSVWEKFIPSNKFSGLASGVFLVFNFFCYDHGINTKSIWYHIYFLTLEIFMVSADIINLYISLSISDHINWTIAIIRMLWIFVDSSFILLLYFNDNSKLSCPFTHQVIVELITRTEIIFCVLLPVYASHNGHTSSNNFAYILLFECFSHNYSKFTFNQKILYWSYILLAIISSFFEWFYISEEVNGNHLNIWIEDLSKIFEIIACVILYSFIYCQLNIKSKEYVSKSMNQSIDYVNIESTNSNIDIDSNKFVKLTINSNEDENKDVDQ